MLKRAALQKAHAKAVEKNGDKLLTAASSLSSLEQGAINSTQLMHLAHQMMAVWIDDFVA